MQFFKHPVWFTDRRKLRTTIELHYSATDFLDVISVNDLWSVFKTTNMHYVTHNNMVFSHM